jgi:hypothetical protein
MLVEHSSQKDLAVEKGGRYASTASTRLGGLRFLVDRRVRLGLLLPDQHKLHRGPFESYFGVAFRHCLRSHLPVRHLLDITNNHAEELGWRFFSTPSTALTA